MVEFQHVNKISSKKNKQSETATMFPSYKQGYKTKLCLLAKSSSLCVRRRGEDKDKEQTQRQSCAVRKCACVCVCVWV